MRWDCSPKMGANQAGRAKGIVELVEEGIEAQKRKQREVFE
jgi:hypothetical protein